MPVIPTPNDRTEFGRAIAVIPDLVRMIEQRDKIRRTPVAAPATSANLITGKVVSDIIAGADLPDGIGAQILDARRAEEEAEQTRAVRALAITTLEHRIEQALEEHVDAALAVLADSLADLLAEARTTITTLGSIQTAEAALRGTAEQQDAYRLLDSLADRYAEIRRAQVQLVSYAWDDETRGDTLRRFGELRGKDELYRAAEDMTPPWPHEDNWPAVPKISPALIRWLVTDPDADPWVPTIPELRAEQEAAGQRELQRRQPVKQELTPAQRRNRELAQAKAGAA